MADLDSYDFASAERHYSTLCDRSPNDPNHWRALAEARYGLGRFLSARKALRRAEALDPADSAVALAQVRVALAMQDWSCALHAASRAVALADSADAYVAYALCLERVGRHADALVAYQDALARDPMHAVALTNCGAILLSAGRLEEAVENNRYLVACHPKLYAACFNLGDALLKCGRHVEAVEAFSQALEIAPNDAKAMLHCGFALALQKKFSAAQGLLDAATRISPSLAATYLQGMSLPVSNGSLRIDARTLYVFAHYDRLERCDWTTSDEFFSVFDGFANDPELELVDSPLGFRAIAVGLPASAQLQMARKVANQIERSIGDRVISRVATEKNGSRIRVGYLSPDFRTHPVGLLVQDLFELHDRDRFEVLCYATSNISASNDSVTTKIRDSADVWRDVANLEATAIAERIASDKVDILIDLAGYTDGGRQDVCALRPASAQISAIGYPGTTGAEWMDYILLDEVVAPAYMDAMCSEKIIRLPHGMFPCSYVGLRFEPMRRADAGYPEQGILLAALHNPYKIEPEVFSVWMRVLQSVSPSFLLLLETSRIQRDNLQRMAQEHGVDATRLIFTTKLPHQEYLRRLALADVFLDTPRYNGGASVCDALVAGVPVLTCKGVGIAQRMAAGLLHAAGFSDGVCDTIEAYETKAKNWVSTPALLADLRWTLLERRLEAPFYRPAEWVAAYESALCKVMGHVVTGTAPEAISCNTASHFTRFD